MITYFLGRIDFEPVHGRQLAYPVKNTIVFLNVDSWNEETTLSCDRITADFSIVQYSPCGKYIAATSLEGDIVVWDVASESVINTGKHEKSIAICGLMWNPKGNLYCFCTPVKTGKEKLTKMIAL